MTKKDYQLIAGAIYRTKSVTDIEANTIKRDAKHAALRLLVSDLSTTLAHENDKFDRDRFVEACGVAL